MSDTPLAMEPTGAIDPYHRTLELVRSAVSWPAIFAGAFVATAASLLLVALGSGLGFAAASPWSSGGAPIATFAIATGLWLVLTQWIAAGVGGYLTGRLRTRWSDVHTHEVFFRDTAHGFLTWALATVMVVLLAAVAGMVANRAADASAGALADPTTYQVDGLFRADRPDDSASALAARDEAARIMARETATTTAPADDRLYLIHLVSTHADLSAAEAEARVDATIATAREAADKARKAASATGIFTALAMLIGAFIACVAAAIGGQERDEHL